MYTFVKRLIFVFYTYVTKNISYVSKGIIRTASHYSLDFFLLRIINIYMYKVIFDLAYLYLQWECQKSEICWVGFLYGFIVFNRVLHVDLDLYLILASSDYTSVRSRSIVLFQFDKRF